MTHNPLYVLSHWLRRYRIYCVSINVASCLLPTQMLFFFAFVFHSLVGWRFSVLSALPPPSACFSFSVMYQIGVIERRVCPCYTVLPPLPGSCRARVRSCALLCLASRRFGSLAFSPPRPASLHSTRLVNSSATGVIPPSSSSSSSLTVAADTTMPTRRPRDISRAPFHFYPAHTFV